MNRFSNWVVHVRRAGWPGGPAAVRLALAVALIGLVAWLYLVEASQMSSIGRRLEAMREQYDQLRRENNELLALIAHEASIARLQQRTADKGLIPAEKVEYLPVTIELPAVDGAPLGQAGLPAAGP